MPKLKVHLKYKLIMSEKFHFYFYNFKFCQLGCLY